MDGAVLAVSETDNSVLSYSDSGTKGNPVEELHIKTAGNKDIISADQLSEEFSKAGDVGKIEIDSVKYCATRIGTATDLFLALFPMEKISNEVITETIVMMLLLFLITGIGVLYMFCLSAHYAGQTAVR